MFIGLHDTNQVGLKCGPTKRKHTTSSLSPRPLIIALGPQRYSLGELHVFNHNLKWAGSSLSCQTSTASRSSSSEAPYLEHISWPSSNVNFSGRSCMYLCLSFYFSLVNILCTCPQRSSREEGNNLWNCRCIMIHRRRQRATPPKSLLTIPLQTTTY